ncbi:MAG: hypoxanthine phosphoribosyltransferase [Actinobacteria bacterium]|nr:MAG: hypoxanthine phosphoribosyltransferase [Actinomycetota bacterium]
MHPEFHKRVIFTEEDISRRVRELGAEITAGCGHGSGPLAVVSILKGGFIFLADLIRAIDLDLTVDFMAISSYRESSLHSSGVRIVKDLSDSIFDRDVLVVEDIVDTGLTLSYILRNLQERGPRDLRVCTLLDRTGSRIAPVRVDYHGFEVGEEFLVGYGLDYMQKWRNLRFICALAEKGQG